MIVSAVFSLFGWLPLPFQLLFGGAVAIFILVALFRLVSAIIKVITDLIPGW